MPRETVGVAPQARDAIYPAIAPENLVGSLEDKVAFVTGAGRGIGKAIALAFAQAGAHVALLARTESQLTAVASEIIDTHNRRTLVLPVDVSDVSAIAAAFEKTESELGKVDIIVANAAITVWRPFVCSDFDGDFWRIMEVNFKSPLFLMQLAIRSMKERYAGGVIIAISSQASILRTPGLAGYSASKTALNTAVGVLQLELDAEEESGILMYCVSPGVVSTEILSGLYVRRRHGEDKKGTMELWKEFLQKHVVPPELCAQTCVYLSTGKAKELRGKFIDALKDIESVVAQAEIVKKENLYNMGIKELGA